jgi:hypothetical protein
MLSNGPNVNEKKDRREQEQSKRTPHHPVILGHYQISPNAFFMHQPKSVRKGRLSVLTALKTLGLYRDCPERKVAAQSISGGQFR